MLKDFRCQVLSSFFLFLQLATDRLIELDMSEKCILLRLCLSFIVYISVAVDRSDVLSTDV